MTNALLHVLRRAALALLVFLPEERRIALERRWRGFEQVRKLRRADLVVVSYGKSGRTWLRVMLSRFYGLLHGLPETALIGFDNLHRRHQAIPKVFFTHDNYVADYTGHADDKRDFAGKRVVLLVRKPQDVAVSQYFQWKFRMKRGKKALNGYPPHGADVSVRDFVMREECGLPRIIDFMNLWAREMPRLGSVLLVRYEDMRRDPEAELRRIVRFAGAPEDPDAICGAVAFSSAENMRRMEERRAFRWSGGRMTPRDRKNPQSYKVRRAKVGGYRDYLDEEEIARVDSLVKSRLDPVFGYGEAQS